MLLKAIVWGSAGYYDTGNELDSNVTGPFGFAAAAAALERAESMRSSCETHLEEQADLVNSTEGLV